MKDDMTFAEFRAQFMSKDGEIEMFHPAELEIWQTYHNEMNFAISNRLSRQSGEINRLALECNQRLLAGIDRQNELLAQVVALLAAKGGAP